MHTEYLTHFLIIFIWMTTSIISGVVEDMMNEPDLECSVWLQRTNSVGRFSCSPHLNDPQRVNIKENGQFDIYDVPPGSYWINESEKGRQVEKRKSVVTVVEGAHLKDIRLLHDTRPFGHIEGLVTDAESGEPVKDFSIYVEKVTNAKEYSPSRGELVYKDGRPHRKDGLLQNQDKHVSAFLVENISPGKALLVVKASGYADERIEVEVQSGEIAKPMVRLQRETVVHVKCAFENREALDYYASVPGNPPLVEYMAVAEDGVVRACKSKPVKEMGYYSLTGLPPGLYTLRGNILYLAGSVSRYATEVINIKADETNDVLIDFTGPCEVTVLMDFPPGYYANAILETADTPSGNEWERDNIGLRARAHFRKPAGVLIPDLKPGRYRLSFFKHSIEKKRGQRLTELKPDEVKFFELKEGPEPPKFVIEL